MSISNIQKRRRSQNKPQKSHKVEDYLRQVAKQNRSLSRPKRRANKDVHSRSANKIDQNRTDFGQAQKPPLKDYLKENRVKRLRKNKMKLEYDNGTLSNLILI